MCCLSIVMHCYNNQPFNYITINNYVNCNSIIKQHQLLVGNTLCQTPRNNAMQENFHVVLSKLVQKIRPPSILKILNFEDKLTYQV